MKKLALLLAAMTAVSAVASAKEVVAAPVVATEATVVIKEVIVEKEVLVQPKLRVTSVELRYANNDTVSDSYNFGAGNWWQLTTSMAYGDNWTGYVRGRRMHNSDDVTGLYEKAATRFQVGAMRNNLVTNFGTYGIGATVRAQDSLDLYMVNTTFKYGKNVGGYLDYGYFARETGANANYVEFQPRYSYNGWGVSYYFEGEYKTGDDSQDQIQHARLFTPTYKLTNELTVSGEYRLSLENETQDVTGRTRNEVEAFKGHRPIVKLNYRPNNMYTFFFDFGYEMRDYKVRNYQKDNSTLRQSIIETGVRISF